MFQEYLTHEGKKSPRAVRDGNDGFAVNKTRCVHFLIHKTLWKLIIREPMIILDTQLNIIVISNDRFVAIH